MDDNKNINMKWIPVSERMPDKYRAVLICNARGDLEVAGYAPLSDIWVSATDETLFIPTDITDEFRIVAWMPLPEPYRKEL